MSCVYQYKLSWYTLPYRLIKMTTLIAIVSCSFVILNLEADQASCFNNLNISIYTPENDYLSSGNCTGFDCDNLMCELLSIERAYLLVITRTKSIDALNDWQLNLPFGVAIASIIVLTISIVEFITYCFRCQKESNNEYKSRRTSRWRITMPTMSLLILFVIIGLSTYIHLNSYLTMKCLGHLHLETNNDASDCIDSQCNSVICNMLNKSNTVLAIRYDLNHETIFDNAISKFMIIIAALAIVGVLMLILEIFNHGYCLEEPDEEEKLIN